MYNLSFLRKLPAVTLCLLITQLTFAKLRYVTNPPTTVSASSSAICSGNSVSLTATCSDGTVTWYNQATEGTSIGSGSPLIQSPTVTTTYYASCYVSGEPARILADSESSRVSAGTVTVTSTPSGPTGVTTNKTAVISGNSVSLSATCASGSVLWYNQLSGGAAIGTGSSLVYYPGSTVTYYASCRGTMCESGRVATSQVMVTAMNLLPYLVKDINTNGANSNSNPDNLINLNGTLVFSANDNVYGNELWKSSPTTGTTLLKDIYPGSAGSDPQYFAIMNGVLYFSAKDSGNNNELWKTDGTEDGTVLVKEINAGDGNAVPGALININGTLFFRASDGVNGDELWKSDGTADGTVMIKDIRPGASGSGVWNLTNVNGVLYFTANDGTSGTEVWKSDGTTDGTVMVKNIRVEGTSDPLRLTNVNGTLFFKAANDSNGTEVWKSDGTAEGTVMVKDILSGSAGSSPDYLINVNGTLYFRAYTTANNFELWKSDGTANGTVMVKDINPGTGDANISELTNINGTLYFIANNGTDGIEVWQSDGTANGTVMVKDIDPGSANSDATRFTAFNGNVYFTANTAENGDEIWKTDGTNEGTILVKDIESGSVSSYPNLYTDVNGALFFRASALSKGIELWRTGTCTDANTIGSNSGKTVYYNRQIQPTSETTTCHCDVFNNIISSTEATGANPVSGNINANVWIESVSPTTYARRHYEINPESGDTTTTGKLTLYFSQADFDVYNTSTGSNVYKLPGNENDNLGIAQLRIERRTGTSSDGTGLATTYDAGIETIDPEDDDIVWNSEANRWEISFNTTGFGGYFLKSGFWPSPTEVSVNKTAICAGGSVSLTATCETGILVWYNQATGGSSIGLDSPLSISLSTTTTYYAACETETSSSNRVATATVNVTPIPGIPTDVLVSKTAIVSGNAVTLSATCASGNVIWYNQLSGGAALGMGTSMPYYPASAVTYYTSCKNGNCESSRVATDSVVVTTMNLLPYLVKDVFLAPDMYGESEDYPSPNSINVNGILYFRGRNTATGKELWKSDGTEAGTVLIKDIRSGSGSSEPENFLNINGVIFFTANDGVNGVELWKTDGTPDGTVMVKNINPSGDSYPGSFINSILVPEITRIMLNCGRVTVPPMERLW